MSDAHTHWIAPFWEKLYSPESNFEEGPRVWVMNPGLKPAAVTVAFFDSVGMLLGKHTETVEPRENWIFGVGSDITANGWCGVASDVPVLPWSVTQFSIGGHQGWANMTFFRVEPLEFPDMDPELIKRLQKKESIRQIQRHGARHR